MPGLFNQELPSIPGFHILKYEYTNIIKKIFRFVILDYKIITNVLVHVKVDTRVTNSC